MKKHLVNVKFISWCLVILYLFSTGMYLQKFRLDPATDSLIMAALFGVLLLGAIGLIVMRDWGRILLLLGNIFLVVYLLIPYFANMEDLLPISYILMSAIVILFYTQDKVRTAFSRSFSGEKEWKSVLIVDDDETILAAVRKILMKEGYSVLTAHSGEDGLYIAKKQRPDLIILDVILPGMKGRELCEKIKGDPSTHDIPVIFLTSKDSPDDIEAEKKAGAQ
ncbi:MAG: response regulator, partial [Candidatus Omnitrophica bacterium]|nr:response regulator [Candidatus Omnitrophota bacterium]